MADRTLPVLRDRPSCDREWFLNGQRVASGKGRQNVADRAIGPRHTAASKDEARNQITSQPSRWVHPTRPRYRCRSQGGGARSLGGLGPTRDRFLSRKPLPDFIIMIP